MAFDTAYPQILANLAAGNEPIAIVDSNFTPLYGGLNSLNTFGNYYVDTGAADAYVVTITARQTATLAAGLPVQFKAAHANTGASTLNVNGTGATNILNPDGTALSAGQILANGIAIVQYDGTQYQLLNTMPGVSRGSFTITLTGMTANPTGTAVYSVTNNVVTLFIPPLTATSNATTMTATGLPAAIQPTTNHGGFPVFVYDNSAINNTPGTAAVSGAVITFGLTASSTGFTNSGTKGIPQGLTITYNLN